VMDEVSLQRKPPQTSKQLHSLLNYSEHLGSNTLTYYYTWSFCVLKNNNDTVFQYSFWRQDIRVNVCWFNQSQIFERMDFSLFYYSLFDWKFFFGQDATGEHKNKMLLCCISSPLICDAEGWLFIFVFPFSFLWIGTWRRARLEIAQCTSQISHSLWPTMTSTRFSGNMAPWLSKNFNIIIETVLDS
jgi:hypothetical protein